MAVSSSRERPLPYQNPLAGTFGTSWYAVIGPHGLLRAFCATCAACAIASALPSYTYTTPLSFRERCGTYGTIPVLVAVIREGAYHLAHEMVRPRGTSGTPYPLILRPRSPLLPPPPIRARRRSQVDPSTTRYTNWFWLSGGTLSPLLQSCHLL